MIWSLKVLPEASQVVFGTLIPPLQIAKVEQLCWESLRRKIDFIWIA